MGMGRQLMYGGNGPVSKTSNPSPPKSVSKISRNRPSQEAESRRRVEPAVPSAGLKTQVLQNEAACGNWLGHLHQKGTHISKHTSLFTVRVRQLVWSCAEKRGELFT
ncbi:hypothetical protein Bbelb_222030 [Branchiostoma belcheri]|nr:hypothetical protein Bbelb_222030 [Branchiostoma belcheri]